MIPQGSIIAGFFVERDWALSFVIPGAIIGGVGVIYFFLGLNFSHQLKPNLNFTLLFWE